MTDYKYKRYPSIENSYQDKVLEYIATLGLSNEGITWGVSEKIHGANLGAYSDGNSTQFASRSQFVNDSFYGLFNGLSERLTPHINQLATDIIKFYADNRAINYIIVYGELFGGMYNHPDVEKPKNVSKIQDRIQYSPNVEFGSFDIYCVCDKDSFFMGGSDYNEFIGKSEIYNIPTLFTGSLKEAMAVSNQFNTTISNDLGFPDIKDNICEGLVIKPLNSYSFHNDKRVILKSKNIKFTEKAERPSREVKELSPEQNEAINISSQYITENRLDAVLSKSGDTITQQLIGKYIGLFTKDAIEELNNESDCLTNLEKKDRKPVTKNLQALAKELVLKRVTYQPFTG